MSSIAMLGLTDDFFNEPHQAGFGLFMGLLPIKKTCPLKQKCVCIVSITNLSSDLLLVFLKPHCLPTIHPSFISHSLFSPFSPLLLPILPASCHPLSLSSPHPSPLPHLSLPCSPSFSCKWESILLSAPLCPHLVISAVACVFVKRAKRG